MSEMTDALWSFFEQEVAPQIMSFQLNDPDQTSPAQVRIMYNSDVVCIYSPMGHEVLSTCF